jgi:flagellar biosynthesis/type III secretory pathway M-ring protein FliF/YscJ
MPDGMGRPSSQGFGSSGPAASPTAYEDQIAQARALVGEDPVRVAQVVKKWVANDG